MTVKIKANNNFHTTTEKTVFDIETDTNIDEMNADKKKLIVIGQQQRCGGSLMVRLFDGHDEIFVHPQENSSGRPYKYHLPAFDVNAEPQVIWETICESHMEAIWRMKRAHGDYELEYGFIKHKRLFIETFPSNPSYSKVFFHYFDTMVQSLDSYWFPKTHKGYLYFTPRQALYAEEILQIFPESHVIQILRNPLGFYNSVKTHNRFYDIVSAKFIWRLFFYNIIFHVKEKLAGFHPVIFEDFLAAPEMHLQDLCASLDIKYNKKMLLPTFNGQDWTGDSHFRKWKGIEKVAGSHYNKYLSEEEKLFFKDDVYLYNSLKEKMHSEEKILQWDEKEILKGLDTFENFMKLYKREKPVNTQGYVFSEKAHELYFGLIDDTSYIHRTYFVMTGHDERKVLIDTHEIYGAYEKFKPFEIASDDIVQLNPALLARFLIGIVNVRGLSAAIAHVSSIPRSRIPETIDEMLRLWHVDSRGINLSMVIFLSLWVIKSSQVDLFPKIFNFCLREIGGSLAGKFSRIFRRLRRRLTL